MKEVKLKSDIFVDTLSFSIGENSQEQEQISCRDFLWGMFTSFLHKVVPQNNLNNFANYHLDLLQYKIPVYIDITFIAVYRFPFISQMSYHSQGR